MASTCISVHIKCANGKKHTVSVDPEGTVPDLKVRGSGLGMVGCMGWESVKQAGSTATVLT